LQTVDHLRVKPAGDLNPHASWVEEKIKEAKIRFLPPSNFILIDNTSEDWVRLATKIDETHP
jgi:hypothetical protein